MRTYFLRIARGLPSLVVLLLLAACGGGGGGGGGGGSTPPPAQTIVSGAVQAPGGQVAFYRQQGPLERFAALFRSVAYAAVTGVSPVPDGTPVQLGQMTSLGTLSILATTNTSGGRYSFNLTSLGLSFSSDLVVRVVNTSTGAQMRAFVTGETVNLDPVSETAVRIILEHLAIPPGASLSNFTPQELRDLVGALDLLTSTNQIAAGLTIETAVTAVKQSAAADAGLMSFLAAAAGVGDTTEGPGDIGNYHPIAQGGTWRFQGTKLETGQQPVNFVNSARIAGTKAVGSLTAIVFAESNPDGLGQGIEDYLIKDNRGITNYGNNDATDLLTPQLIPYRTLRFPLQPGATFESVNKAGLNFGDLDGDGKNETGDVLAQVTVVAFESVIVPAGTFANSAKIEARITNTVTLSSNGTKVTVTETHTEWLAPGVGPVKRQSQTTGQGFSETVTEELAKEKLISTGNVVFPSIAVSSQGDVNVVWGQTGCSPCFTGFSHTKFDGNTPVGALSFSAPLNISEGNGSEGPRIAVDGADNIYVVSNLLGGSLAFTRSSNGGTTFSNPAGILDPAERIFSPRVAVDGAGNIYVAGVKDASVRVIRLVRSTDKGDGHGHSTRPGLCPPAAGGDDGRPHALTPRVPARPSGNQAGIAVTTAVVLCQPSMWPLKRAISP